MQHREKLPFRIILLIIATVFIAVTVAYILFWSPWSLQRYYHDGVEYYTDGKYLEFENGEDFQTFIESYPWITPEGIVDFHHTNNSWGDNILSGKHADIYALDVQVSEEMYSACKDAYCLDENFSCELYSYVLYFTEEAIDNSVTVLAFNDEQHIIRCIMITEKERETLTYRSVVGEILIGRSKLEFK